MIIVGLVVIGCGGGTAPAGAEGDGSSGTDGLGSGGTGGTSSGLSPGATASTTTGAEGSTSTGDGTETGSEGSTAAGSSTTDGCTIFECVDRYACEIVTLEDCSCRYEDVKGEAPSNWQTDGDCRVLMCDERGLMVLDDPADVPDDDNACTADTCSDEGPLNTPLDEGTACGDRGRCDGRGTCLE